MIKNKILLLVLVINSSAFCQEGTLCPKTEKFFKGLTVVKRTEWGARVPITKENITEADKIKGAGPITEYSDYGLKGAPAYTRVILHNTAMMYEDKNTYGTQPKGCGNKQAKYIQDYEMDEHDIKADTGYNFFIDRCGTIYEGRSLSYFPSHTGSTVEENKKEDLTLDPDYGSIGVALIDHSNEPLTIQQIEAAEKLITFTINCYDVNKVITHAEVKSQLEDGTLLGQKLTLESYSVVDPKVCPGSGTIDQIITIRKYFNDNFSIPFDEDAYRKLFQ